MRFLKLLAGLSRRSHVETGQQLEEHIMTYITWGYSHKLKKYVYSEHQRNVESQVKEVWLITTTTTIIIIIIIIIT
jgi:hypothetical protein